MSYNDTRMSRLLLEFDSIKIVLSISILSPDTYLMSIRDVFCQEFHATLILLSELSDRQAKMPIMGFSNDVIRDGVQSGHLRLRAEIHLVLPPLHTRFSNPVRCLGFGGKHSWKCYLVFSYYSSQKCTSRSNCTNLPPRNKVSRQ